MQERCAPRTPFREDRPPARLKRMDGWTTGQFLALKPDFRSAAAAGAVVMRRPVCG